MPKYTKGLAGLHNPTNHKKESSLFGTEFSRYLEKFAAQEKVKLKRENSMFRRRLAGSFIIISIFILAIFLLIGSSNRNYELAEKWWMFIGPLVGYLINVIFWPFGKKY